MKSTEIKLYSEMTSPVLLHIISGYYLDPNEVARRIMRVISLHDNVKNPESMTLNSQWWELGSFLFYTIRHQWIGLRLNHDRSRKRIQNRNLWWSRRKVQGCEWCSRVCFQVILGCLIFSALIYHSFLFSHTFLQSSLYRKNSMRLNKTIETWEIV